jgi:hypothetical protein
MPSEARGLRGIAGRPPPCAAFAGPVAAPGMVRARRAVARPASVATA